jgi:hypothetical protein
MKRRWKAVAAATAVKALRASALENVREVNSMALKYLADCTLVSEFACFGCIQA